MQAIPPSLSRNCGRDIASFAIGTVGYFLRMVNMGIREKVERLAQPRPPPPQYPNQGAVLFVDLERRQTRRAYLPLEVLRTFLGGRGANTVRLFHRRG